MSGSAAVVRDAAGLGRLAALIATAPIRPIESVGDIEDANLTVVAQAVVAAAARREESRGCHFRSDHPTQQLVLTGEIAGHGV